MLGEAVTKKIEGGVLHAATTAGPVAVVEVQAFALEYEGAYAVLLGH